MTPTGTRPPPPTGPQDPVRAALEDADLWAEMLRHAHARLGAWLADRSPMARADAADDAVQEAMRRVLEQSDRFDPARSSVAAWAHGVLELVLHEQCRSIRKLPEQPAADPSAWDSLTARLTSEHDSIGELLAVLPDDQRRIVTMFHLEEKSHEQIALELGISVGNSRVRLARAMTTLKEHAAKGGGQ